LSGIDISAACAAPPARANVVIDAIRRFFILCPIELVDSEYLERSYNSEARKIVWRKGISG
jgi:hypothetical protein